MNPSSSQSPIPLIPPTPQKLPPAGAIDLEAVLAPSLSQTLLKEKEKKISRISEKAKKFAQREAQRKIGFQERRQRHFRQGLLQQMKGTPWWLISCIFHTLLFLFFAHILVSFEEYSSFPLQLGWEQESLQNSTVLAEETKKPPEDSPPDNALEKQEQDLSPPDPPPNLSLDVTPADPEKSPEIALGSPQNAFKESASTTTPALHPSLGARSETGKGYALKKYGGSVDTETAVREGLGWLVRHQSPDGSWSGDTYLQQCQDGKCDRQQAYYDYQTGFTGLALLCFLGAGHTHRQGDYAEVVNRALEFILQNQMDDGYFGPEIYYEGESQLSYRFMYNHAVACLAILEAYGLTQDPRLAQAGQKGVDFLTRTQQRRGGWDYYDIRSNRNDTSITGWVIMALKSAKYSKLLVPSQTWHKSKAFIESMYQEEGSYLYADHGPPWNYRGRKGAGMAAVGALCELYFGASAESPRLQTTITLLLRYLPDWKRLKNTPLNPTREQGIPTENKEVYNYNTYAWYYSTLVLFQVGGEVWETWNSALKKALLPHQEKRGCKRGSWSPVEQWLGPYAGRLYSTTLNILNLEVYYRYLPLYQTLKFEEEDRPPTPEEVLQLAQKKLQGEQREKTQALELFSEFQDPESKQSALPHILKMLEDPSLTVRWKAIRTLQKLQAPSSIPPLIQAYHRPENQKLQRFLIETLALFEDPRIFTFLVELLRKANGKEKEKAIQSLKQWSGVDCGSSPETWEKWWASQAPQAEEKKASK
jgi:hypothetical protein